MALYHIGYIRVCLSEFSLEDLDDRYTRCLTCSIGNGTADNVSESERATGRKKGSRERYTEPLHMHMQQRNTCRHGPTTLFFVLTVNSRKSPKTDTFNNWLGDMEKGVEKRSIKRTNSHRQHTRTSGLTWLASPFNAKLTGCKKLFLFFIVD